MSPSLAAVRALNASFSPSYLPVAVFVGGTSGIGQGIAEAFAQHTKGNAHIILVGRNQKSAQAIISKFPKPTSSSAKHEFITCDASLMKNVEEANETLLKLVPKINFLVISTGIISMNGRDETTEGIDKKLAVHYYARWKFIHGLAPALVKAQEAGEDARVLSVLGAGKGGPVNADDFGLKKTFSLANAAHQGITYNDLMMEEYAARYPSVAFIHAFPGHVRTNIMSASPSLLMRVASPLVTGPLSPFKRPADAGEFLLGGLLNTATKPGVWRLGEFGEDIGKTAYFGDEGTRKKLWEHTVEATGTAEKTQ